MKYQNKLLIIACFLAIGLVAPLASFGAQVDSAPTNGLVGYWGFEEATGTTAFDSSGNHNAGVLSGATKPVWVAGNRGKALNFDGATSYVAIPANPSLEMGTADMTMSAWVKFTSSTNTHMTIFGKGAHSNLIAGYMLTYYPPANVLYAEISDGVTRIYPTASVPNLVDGRWHHIAVSINRASNEYFYLDGKYIDSANISSMNGKDITNQSKKMYIGSWDLSNYCLPGSIDEARIYNRALSATEISAVYNAGVAKINAQPTIKKTGLDAGLVGYYTMDNQDINWTTRKMIDKSGTTTTPATLVGLASATSTATGKFGQAINLISSSTYITTNYILTGPTKTVSTWVYRLGTLNSYAPIVEQGGAGSESFRLIVYSRTRICFGYDSVVNNFYCTNSSVVGQFKKWDHIVGIYDGSSAKIYVNGNLQTLTQTTGNYGPWGGTSLNIGFRPYSSLVDSWKGLMDETRIYNRALSATEVKQLYKQGAGTKVNAAPAVKPLTLDSGLVGYWTMNNQDINWRNLTMADKSGSGNTATLISMPTSTAPVVGKVGQALKFDGSSSYVNVSTSSNLDFDSTQSLTLGAWVKLAPDISDYRAIAGKASGSSIDGYFLNLQSGGNLSAVVDGVDSGLKYVISTKDYRDNKWHYSLMVVNRSNQTLSFYIDGVQIGAPVDISSVGTFVNSYNFQIGSLNTGVKFKGAIDEVKIYNRALSASEVKQLYNQGK